MKEKKDCKIVQDLLPSYIEKLTNEETNKYIDEHLKECDECKNIYENMKKDLNVEPTKKDKKAVKYFKKYRNKLRILRIILLIILIALVLNTTRKVIIFNEISEKAENSISTENYHRKIYSYDKEKTSTWEAYSLGDKKKIIMKNIKPEGTETITVYAKKERIDEWGNERYKQNTYTIVEGKKIAKINKEAGISIDPQNIFKIDNFLALVMTAIPASISTTTYYGEECYYISNLQSFYTFPYKDVYVSKNTGLPLGSIGYELENSDGEIGRWPSVDYSYEFNTVTEEDFIEPDLSEYEIVE